MGYGRDTIIGWAPEAEYGTYVAPTKFWRTRSCAMNYERAVIDEETIIAGQLTPDVAQMTAGDITASASITMPLLRSMGDTFWQLVMGADVVGGGTPDSPKTYVPGDLTGRSVSLMEAAKTSAAAADDVVSVLLGAKITTLALAAQVGQVCTLDIGLVGQDVDRSQPRPVAAYALTAGDAAMSYAHGSATIAGAGRRISALTLNIENNLAEDRRFLGSRTIDEPLDDDSRSYSWDVSCEYETAADYDEGDLTSAAIVATFTAGAHNLRLTSPACLLDGNPIPPADRRGVLTQSLTYRAYDSGASKALTVEAWTTA